MIDFIGKITQFSIVSSVETVLSAGRIKHYRINIEVENAGLYKEIERLWNFGTVRITRNMIAAEYIVTPEEILKFYCRLKKLASGIDKKNPKTLDIQKKTVYN